MVKLSSDEWNRMKRPIYPKIEFTSSTNNFHVQTMIDISTTTIPGKTQYFIPYIKVGVIDDIVNFEDFIIDLKLEVMKISDNYVISEEDKNLFKINGDGEE